MDTENKICYSSVHVFVNCKSAQANEFLNKSRKNASNSVLEEGIARFDVLQNIEEPSKFILLEVYKNQNAPTLHKTTQHYNEWRENVADMMEAPRQAKRYKTLFPSVEGWYTDRSASLDTELSGDEGMLSVLVDVQVIPGTEEAFIEATVVNASNSLTEGGISRFDLVQNEEDPCNFVLHEVYNSANGAAAHKETEHYKNWRAQVEGMMARPRESQKYTTRFPSRVHWHMTERVSHQNSWALSPVSSTAFEFMSGNIVFGRNTSSKLPGILQKLKVTKALMVTGRTGAQRYTSILNSLQSSGIEITCFPIEKEPGTQELLAGVQLARDSAAEAVIGLGGGSVIDGAKAIAALATNPGSPLDYMEIVGKGMAITVQPLPFIAMPTTAGTGSEVTKNSVITAEEHNRKVSIRSPMMIPTVALVDPVLAVGAPPQVTAFSGLDCLTQCIEPYVSRNANPFTDGLSKEGILRASRSLRAVYRNGEDLDAREDLAAAATIGGLALANAKLGAVHGFAGYVGGRYPSAPHGAVCAALLPHVFRMNSEVLAEKAKTEPKYEQYYLRHVEVAKIITGNPTATVEEGASWLEALTRDLNVPSLSTYGMSEADFTEVAENSAVSSSMQGNPISLTTQQLIEILQKAC